MAEGNTTRRTAAQSGSRSRSTTSQRQSTRSASAAGTRTSSAQRRSGATSGSAGRSGTASGRGTGTRQAQRSGSGSGRSASARSGRTYTRNTSAAAYSRTGASSRSRREEEYDPRIPTGSTRGYAGGQDEDVVKRDVIVILLFAAMVFLFLSNFGILGPVGNFFSNLMFGLCGFTAYILPVVVFILTLFYYANRSNERIYVKIGAAVALFLVFGIICEMAAGRISQTAGYDIADLYMNSVAHKNGGGVLAGSLAYLFVSLFKTFGTVLVLIIVSVISVVLLTQRSLIDFVGDTTAAAKERHEEKMRELEEEARYAAAEDERYGFRRGGAAEDQGDEVPWDDAAEEDTDRNGMPEGAEEVFSTANVPRESRDAYVARQDAEGGRRTYGPEDEDGRSYGSRNERSGGGRSRSGLDDGSGQPGFLDGLIARLTSGAQDRSRARMEKETAREELRQERARQREEERMQRAEEQRRRKEAAENDRILYGEGDDSVHPGNSQGKQRQERIFRGVQNTVLTDDPVLAQQKARELARVMPGAAGDAAAVTGSSGTAAAAVPGGSSPDSAGPDSQQRVPASNVAAVGSGNPQPERGRSRQDGRTAAADLHSGAVVSEDLHEVRPDDYGAGYDSVLTLQPDLEAIHAEAAAEDTHVISAVPYESGEGNAAEADYGSDAFSSRVIGQGIGDAIDHDVLDTVSGIVRNPEESEDLHSIHPEDYAIADVPAGAETSSPETDTGLPDPEQADHHRDAAASEPDPADDSSAPVSVDYSNIPLLHFEDDEVIPPIPDENDAEDTGEGDAADPGSPVEAVETPVADQPLEAEAVPSWTGEPDQPTESAETDQTRMPEVDQDAGIFPDCSQMDMDISASSGSNQGDGNPDDAGHAVSGAEQYRHRNDAAAAGNTETASEETPSAQAAPVSSGAAESCRPAAEEMTAADAEAAKDIAVHKEGVTDIADDIVAAKTTDEVLRSKADHAPDRTASQSQPLTSGGARFTDLSAVNRASAGNSTSEAGTDSRPKALKTWHPRKYIYPPMDLLEKGPEVDNADSANELRETAMKLQNTLKTFGVNVRITDISQGPAVTRYEMQPEQGVKVSKIVSLQDDIKLALAATDIRIEAPIPGKSAVGIEVPNKTTNMVALRDILDTPEFRNAKSKTAFGVGKDIAGKTVIADIAKMPHVLIAGATGSGKSVCINTIIMSILYHASPDEVKMIMIDPKVVELSVYNGIPHLLLPVVTDSQKAAATLNWCVAEMEQRFHRFADASVRDIKGYNALVKQKEAAGEEDPAFHFMPHIIIIVDELADLMMVAKNEVETAICRLAQLARAAGMHLIIATQRPSVDVITGLIKANMPSRIAFAVTQGVDSRTILDMNGAEKLLGKGDMLFFPQGLPKPQRIQGAFVSDEEVTRVVNFLKQNDPPEEDAAAMQQKLDNIANGQQNAASGGSGTSSPSQDEGPQMDELFEKAGKFIIEKNSASIGLLQRMFRIGFNRAARIMDELCDAGVVSESEGTKPRKILMTEAEFEDYLRDIRQ